MKTQIQKMQPDAEGKLPYSGSMDCAMKTLKAGGPLKFYTGFPVYCIRIAPHVMVRSLARPPFSILFSSRSGLRAISKASPRSGIGRLMIIYQDFTSNIMIYDNADDMDFPQPSSKVREDHWTLSSGMTGFHLDLINL